MDDDATMAAGSPFGGMLPLAEVRDELGHVETLEDEIAHRVAQLRAILPADQFRLVWALQDAEETLGRAERALGERRLVAELARCLPEHGPAIRAAARRLLGEETSADESA